MKYSDWAGPVQTVANVKLYSFLLVTTREEKLLDGARRAALLQCEMKREVSDEIASIKSGPKSVSTRRVYSGGMESL